MSLFKSEAEMQSWLRKELKKEDSISHLVINDSYIENFKPKNPVEKRFIESYRVCWHSFHEIEIISDNENISMKPGEILKPDFLLYAPETESMVVVELKNIGGPTRQAGTEMAAYSSEIRSYLPFMADGDIVNVIISTEWPVLLCHYIFHEIFWMQRNVICLEPIKDGKKIKLQLKNISDFLDDEASLKISERYLGGYQLCLYDDKLYSENPDRTRLDKHIEQMKAALLAMGAKGDALKSHGFAFLWKDNWSQSLAPYSITMLNFASFQGIERFVRHAAKTERSEMQNRFIKLVRNFDPMGHGQTLQEVKDYGCAFLSGFCSPHQEGFTHWKPLRDIMLSRCSLLSFSGWGVFRELFFDRLNHEYSRTGKLDTRSDCPDLGLEVVESLISYNSPHFDLSFLDDDALEKV